MAFADRFLARIEQAADSIESATSDPEIRFRAHRAKYSSSLGVVTTAADPDPEVAMLDLVTVVSLERMVWSDGRAELEFGSLGSNMVQAYESLEADVWSIAGKVLTEDQMALLRSLIQTWRAEHQDQTFVSMVRFDDFTFLRDTAARSRSSLVKINLVLSDTDAAAAEIRKTRLLGERAVFLAGRMPLLISWQTELLAYELALAPEIQQSLQNARDISAAITQLSGDVHALPDRLTEQVESTVQILEEHEGTIDRLITSMREGLAEAGNTTEQLNVTADHFKSVASEATAAANALNETIISADALIARFDRPEQPQPGTQPTARPFDVREYTHALGELTVAARELNALVRESDAMLQSPAWESRVKVIDDAAANRIDQVDQMTRNWLKDLDDRGDSLASQVTSRGIVLICIACAGALATALIFRFITRSR